ncbi:rhamnan synthesis F family protein [Paraglaciecola aestuariivivens]
MANTLASNGVNLGEQLMGASFANPNGHFEDIPAVNLHDQILGANATDWRYYGERQLKVTAYFQTKLENYYQQRLQATSPTKLLGLKDPRAVFFIENWHQATQGNLKTLLVYRDWRFSISSLYKRHSRELLQFTSPIAQRKLDYQFWQQPELAAKMWLASANAMLNWVKQHPQDTLLFEQNAFVSQQQELKTHALQKGFEAQILSCTVFDKALMQANVPQSLLDMVPQQLQNKCNQAQAELNQVADVFTEEKVISTPSDALSLALKQNLPAESVGPSTDLALNNTLDLSQLSWEDAIETLRALPADSTINIDWKALLGRDNLKSTQYDALYVVAIKFKQWQVAENAIHRALAFKAYHYRYIHLGDMYMRYKIPEQAKHYYQLAQELAPNNSVPLAKLAEVEILLGQLEQAQALIDQAIQLDPTKPAIASAQKRLAQKAKALQPKAEQVQSLGIMHTIEHYQQVVKVMSTSFEQGKALDDYMVKAAFIIRNNQQWLTDGLKHLSPRAQSCLLDYLVAHLRKYWPDSVLSTELTETAELPLTPIHLPKPTPQSELKIGCTIHVYHQHLLPELLTFVNHLPYLHKLVVTCPHKLVNALELAFSEFQQVEIVAVENRGRDILPWLSIAPKLESCDLVVKLHTKSTPHSSALSGWRLQLLWMLLGDPNSIQKILEAFTHQSQLGMVIPNFHPHIAKHINWGENQELATELAQKLQISLPDSAPIFPAGSMFWYRPSALKNMTSYPWQLEDFPQESGQIDGTIMHALERILSINVQQQGFDVVFSQALTWEQ